MKDTTKNILNDLIIRHSPLEVCYDAIYNAIDLIILCYKNKNKLLICGNGGSAADSEHIVGELMKSFLLPRKLDKSIQKQLKTIFPNNADYFIENLQEPLPAISLVSESALISAFANDQAPDLSFAQQVLGYGAKGDVLIAISTSGNSKNVVYAAQIAKAKGLNVISLTGNTGGNLKALSDVIIKVPSDETFIIQEYHLPVYHALCACVENEFFSKGDS